MRASEFIVEDKVISQRSFDRFLNDCSEYFSHISHPYAVMVRGDAAVPPSDSFVRLTRDVSQGRRPVDVDQGSHDVINSVFVEEFGFPFRNGLMCTGNDYQASNYGPLRIIVPANGYTLCYSQKYVDLYSSASREIKILRFALKAMELTNLEYQEKRNQLGKLTREFISDGMYLAGPQYTEAAIASNHEIMLYPTNGAVLGYYAFTPSFWDKVVNELDKRKL